MSQWGRACIPRQLQAANSHVVSPLQGSSNLMTKPYPPEPSSKPPLPIPIVPWWNKKTQLESSEYPSSVWKNPARQLSCRCCPPPDCLSFAMLPLLPDWLAEGELRPNHVQGRTGRFSICWFRFNLQHLTTLLQSPSCDFGMSKHGGYIPNPSKCFPREVLDKWLWGLHPPIFRPFFFP